MKELLKKIKRLLIKLSYMPEKVMFRLYYACAHNKLPCPDKLFQKWDYWIFNKKKLNFKNPQTYNEKLQWMKYYYRNPAYTPLVDKYEVRKFVEEKVGADILVPCLGIFDKWDEIDFSKLPNAFVIKCTHDSGSVVVCRDKNNWDIEAAKKKIEFGLGRNQFYLSREWPYKNVKPRIIIEEYLSNKDGSSLVDYKFMCFDGKPEVIDVLTGKNNDEPNGDNFFDLDWNLMKVYQAPNTPYTLNRPVNFDKMVEYSKILSKGFPHVRVDFLQADDKLYFTEMTFFPAGGRQPFDPEEYDYYLGSLLKLPPKMR